MINDDRKTLLEVYSEYNRHLRNWLILFGVGIIGVIFSNDLLIGALTASNNFKDALIYFAIGVGLQIAIAVINKYYNWRNYYLESHPISTKEKDADSKRKFWLFADWIWVDWLVDLLTIIFFVCGLYEVYQAVFAILG